MTRDLDWFPELPSVWRQMPLKAVCDYRVSNVDKVPSENELPVRLCNYTDVYHNEFITLDMELMETTATGAEIERFGLDVSDVVITKDSEAWNDIGVPAVIAETAPNLVCGYHLAMLRPVPEILDGRYLFRCLQARPMQFQFERSASGVTRYGLGLDAIGRLYLPIPPLPRQRAIAAYLDRETAKIDAMIAAKERLLTLLAEKRRALITHAVTRGLDPDAPMKDSGVEWLGEIPEHWTLTRLKFLAEIRGGVTLGKSYGIKPLIEVPYLRVANVQVGRVNLDEVKNISVPSEERDRYLLRAGDLLMTEGGDIDKLGRGCVWREQIAPCIHQNHVFAVRPHDVDPEWLARWTDAEPSRAYFEITAKRSTNLASISGSNIGELPVLVPPGAETVQILSHIEHGMGQLDALSEHAGSTIQLLRERRSALIAAAVTGQVDVEDAA